MKSGGLKQVSVNKKILRRTFSEIVDTIHDLPGDPYAIEQVEPDLAFLPFGSLWICEHGTIHIGFHLDVPAEIIAHLVLALAKYKSVLFFETIPVFISEEKLEADEEFFFEGEQALIEYGKLLVGPHFSEDHYFELFRDEKNKKIKH